MTYEALVAVVAQHEDLARRHAQRRQGVVRWFRGVGFDLDLPVDDQLAVAHLVRGSG